MAESCPSRVLVLPRHLTVDRYAIAAVCDLDPADGHQVHDGEVCTVRDDRIVDHEGHRTSWTDASPKAFRRPDGLAHAYEPPLCAREVADLDGARCSLPARHGGECTP